MIKSDILVMVVDDEPSMCDVIERILKQEGYKVIMASNGKRALKLAEENKPDVILLDLGMPGMDGREVCRRIRGLSTKTQIIYFTARVEQGPAKLKELRSEADAFITKPAISKQILSRISSVLQTGHIP